MINISDRMGVKVGGKEVILAMMMPRLSIYHASVMYCEGYMYIDDNYLYFFFSFITRRQ